MIQSRLDLDFIERTLKTSGIVLLVALVFGVVNYGLWDGLAFFSGGVWGLVNLMLLKKFVEEAFKPDGIDGPSVLVLGLVKFPLLYVSGYYLMSVEYFDVMLLLYGFSTILAIMLLKAIGRVMLGMDSKEKNQTIQKVI